MNLTFTEKASACAEAFSFTDAHSQKKRARQAAERVFYINFTLKCNYKFIYFRIPDTNYILATTY